MSNIRLILALLHYSFFEFQRRILQKEFAPIGMRIMRQFDLHVSQCQASNDESHNDDPEAQKSNGNHREDTDDGKAVDEEELVEL